MDLNQLAQLPSFYCCLSTRECGLVNGHLFHYINSPFTDQIHSLLHILSSLLINTISNQICSGYMKCRFNVVGVEWAIPIAVVLTFGNCRYKADRQHGRAEIVFRVVVATALRNKLSLPFVCLRFLLLRSLYSPTRTPLVDLASIPTYSLVKSKDNIRDFTRNI